jgi:predicted DNA-binding transcriptional regulator YafY
MAQNKNALIRYKTIDKCLQNRYRQWTLEDIIEACSQALYEYEGKEANVSKRTIQLDIQTMRSEKLGYNAPIMVYDKKYYKYDDDNFSITDIPITENDMNVLSETVSMLKQFKDFSLFADVSDILQRLEDKVYAEKTNSKPVIYLDKNENLKGLHFFDELYQSIVKNVALKIVYHSFKSQVPSEFIYYPFALKEFNNRWFLVGVRAKNNQIQHLALDRIVSVGYDFSAPEVSNTFDGDEYYKDIVGVTVNNVRPSKIDLWIDAENAPYVLTKPLHSSQTLVRENGDKSVVIRLKLKVNFEFERLVLGYGESIEVLHPAKLRARIKSKLQEATARYDYEPEELA